MYSDRSKMRIATLVRHYARLSGHMTDTDLLVYARKMALETNLDPERVAADCWAGLILLHEQERRQEKLATQGHVPLNQTTWSTNHGQADYNV